MPKEMQTLKLTLAPFINIFHTKDSRETCIYNRPSMNIEEKNSMQSREGKESLPKRRFNHVKLQSTQSQRTLQQK